MANLKLQIEGGTGFTSVQQNITKTSELTKGMLSDFGRVNDNLGGITGNLTKLTGLSAISFAGIALTAPRLAGDLALINAALFKITDALAVQLKPAMDWLTGAMTGIGNYLQANPWAANVALDLLVLAGVVGIGGLLYQGLAWLWGTWTALAAGARRVLSLGLTGVAAASTALDAFAVGLGATSFASLAAGITIPIALAIGVPNALAAILPNANTQETKNATAAAQATPMSAIPGFVGGVQGISQLGQTLTTGVEASGAFQGGTEILSDIINLLGGGSNSYTPEQIAGNLGKGAVQTAFPPIIIFDSAGRILQQYNVGNQTSQVS